jgi:chromosome partitioning protein
MSLKVTVPSRIAAGLGWPRLARWSRSLGWPGDQNVPRETSPVASASPTGEFTRNDDRDGGVASLSGAAEAVAEASPPPTVDSPPAEVVPLGSGADGPGIGADGPPSGSSDRPVPDGEGPPVPEAVPPSTARVEPEHAIPPTDDRVATTVETVLGGPVPRETAVQATAPPATVLDEGPAPEVARGANSVESVIKAPGPRRAKFDRDEFDTGGVEEAEPGPAVPSTRASTLPKPATTRVFVVANQKGGVGKTTTSVNLAAGLALGGLNVLVLDLDPQGNASTALGIEHSPGTPGTYEVLIEGSPIEEHLVTSPEAPRLQVLPATIDLAGAEIQLVSMVARENRLRKALRAYLSNHAVDYVFLDCPPSLGLITLNALVAATEILIPIQCEYYALEGVSQLVRTINLIKGELNEDLEVSTVLLTMYDARTRLAAQVADEVRGYFSEQTLPTVIPRSVRISEAPSYGQTVLTYHPDSAGAVSYLEAAREIARRGAKGSG